MESQMFNQWVQVDIPETSSQNAVGLGPQHDTARSDNWSKERPQSMANLTTTALNDLNEFSTLSDLGECLQMLLVTSRPCRGGRHDARI